MIMIKTHNKMTRLILLASIIAHYLFSSNTSCLALNVLVVGGSGRVGGSTVRWLKTLSDRKNDPISITVGGRRQESYEIAMKNKVIPSSGVDFLSMDIDGEVSALQQSLQNWKSKCTSDDNDCLVVHTAGPFQGRRDPTLLSSCLDLSIPYCDVCDEWELAEASKLELDQKAKDARVPAIVSCGIWPGVSALMAAEGVSQLKGNDEEMDIESIDYSFFTSGTGNAGPTIVSATFLLLATEVITFLDGKRKDIEPWTEMREIDFGKGIGMKPVWLLDNPDVPTTALYVTKGAKAPNCASRFGTDPLPWNYLFGAMKALPRSLLVSFSAMYAHLLQDCILSHASHTFPYHTQYVV